MPRYRWFCKNPACRSSWDIYTSIDRRDDPVACPDCGEKAERNFAPRIYYIPDIDHSDGRTGEPVEMPAFGPDVRITSRRQLRDLQKRTAEEYFKRTDGAHTVLRPFKDPDTGKITYDKVTTHREGIDLGEIHTIDSPDPGEPISEFNPSKTLSEHEKELEDKLAPDPAA